MFPGEQFDFRHSILAGLNRTAEFTSSPKREAIVDRAYTYRAAASDQDGDSLTFGLISGPVGMVIDAATGIVTWSPVATDPGNHEVILSVGDGKGGKSLQAYTLSAIEPPPNRPPVVLSNPEVLAKVGEDYVYSMLAEDADSDTLLYSVISAPAGLLIDASSGQVTWRPTGGQIGLQAVQLQVSDGQGGEATQEYRISVLANPQNNSPVFTSSPPTTLNLPGSTNPSTGIVDPTSIAAELASGNSLETNVSITLPDEEVEAFADIVFIVDETGNMDFNPGADGDIDRGRQGWIPSTVQSLDDQLNAAGIGPNRFALTGFGHYRSATLPVQLRDHANVETIQLPTANPVSIQSSLRSADLDGDGDLDLVASQISHYVMLNNGDGSLAPEVVYPTSDVGFKNGVEILDMNVDGIPDIVSQGINGVQVLIGNGDGSFEPVRFTGAPVRLLSSSIAIGDINSDGAPDVISAAFNVAVSPDLFVFLNDGSGTLLAPQSLRFDGLSELYNPNLADINGDGFDDLVMYAREGTGLGSIFRVRSALGDGTGSFATPQIVNDQAFGDVHLIDLNQDDRPDLLWDSGQGGTLYSALNDGDGTFGLGHSFAIGGYGSFAGFLEKSTVDLNDDDNVDLVLRTGRGVSVLFGDGNGGFPVGEQYQAFASPTYNLVSSLTNTLAIGDFDGDGNEDVVLTDTYDSELTLLRGTGGGEFDGPKYRHVTTPVVDVAAADFDGDGTEDWVTISSAYQTQDPLLSVFIGDGQRGFALRTDYPIGPSDVIAVGDLDNDGDPDIAVNQNRLELLLFLNDGNGLFEQGPTQTTTAGFAVRSLQIADVNGDGFNDLIASASGGSSIYYGSSSGVFSTPAVPTASTTGNDFSRQAVADFNGDGFLDIASPTNSTAGFNILLSTANGSYKPNTTTFTNGSVVAYLAHGDVDADGDLDLYTVTNLGAVASLWRNDGTGSFSLSMSGTIPFRQANNIVSADLNGDGFADAIVSGQKSSPPTGFPHSADVAILYSRGDGTFGDPVPYEAHGAAPTSTGTNALAVSDFNGDGLADLLAGSGNYDSLSILLNDGHGDFGRFGTSQDLGRSLLSLNSDAVNPGVNGIYPDAYLPIESALDYVPRPGATPYFVLITATDRNVRPNTPSFADIRDELQNRGVVFDVVVDAEFQDGSNQFALAVDGLGQAIVTDGAGGVEVTEGGQFVSGVGQPDYVDLSWSLGGTSWDLDSLRNNEDGVARQAFIDRFIQQVQDRQASPITVISSDPAVLFENLSGPTAGVGPGQTASFDIQLTGDGNAAAFDLLFVQEATNTIVGSIPVTINTLYEYDASAIDPDGDVLTYQFLEVPEEAEIDSASGMIAWRPTVAGQYPFEIEVSDPLGGTDVQSFVVTVTSGRENTAPEIIAPNPAPATVGQSYTLQIEATDAEDDRLSYFLVDAPENLSIDSSSGQILWIPDDSQVGQQQVTVQVRDGRGGIAETNFAVSVLNAPFNRSPRIQSIPPSTAPVGEPLIYQAVATDADGHPIHWNIAVGPEGSAIDPETGVFVWTAKEYQSRPIDVVIRAADDYGGVDLQRFQIALDRPNSAPLILNTPDSLLVAGLPHEYKVLAQDGENETLTYELDAPGTAAVIDTATGIIRWTPTIDDLGTFDITVTVTDEQGNSSTSDFVLEVAADAANAPPLFVNVPDRINPRIMLDYRKQLQAVDPNGDPLFFELLSGPADMTISPSGLLLWRPAADDAAEYTVRAQVSDGRGGVSTVEFLALAAPIEQNSPPTALNDPPKAAVVGRVYAHDFIGYDLEGDSILWSLRTGPVGMSIDPERGTLRWVPQDDQIGQHAVSVLVLDGQFQFGFDVVSFLIDVRAGNSPPLITSVPPTIAAANETLTYQAIATDVDGDSLSYQLPGTLGAIDPVTGQFSWTPGDANVGANRISIAVSDGVATTYQTFDVVVEPDPRNKLPSFESTPSFLATIDELYQYQSLAIDPEGGNVSYELVSALPGNDNLIFWLDRVDSDRSRTGIRCRACDG